MVVLVCGGRNYSNKRSVYRALDLYHYERGIEQVVHGGCSGADALAKQWAEDNAVRDTACMADWATYGKKAGPLRNKYMIAIYQPDIVLAFEGSKGTEDCVRQARRAGVCVLEIQDN